MELVEPYVNWLGGEDEFVGEDHRPVRLDASPEAGQETPILKIEKKWGKNWYQLLADSYVNQVSIPTKESKGDWGLMPGYHNWEVIRRNDDPTPDAPIAYEKEGNSGWEEWDRLDPRSTQGPEVLSFDPTSKKLFSVTRYNSQASGWWGRTGMPLVQKVKQNGSQSLIYGTTLFPSAPQAGEPRSCWNFSPELKFPVSY